MQDKQVSQVVENIRRRVEQDGLSPDAAAQQALDEYLDLGVPSAADLVAAGLERYREQLERIEFLQLATIPRRRHNDWYGGPKEGGIWSGLKQHLAQTKGFDEDTVASIDDASSKIVSLLDNPGKSRFSTRSLVVGHVQSGKTANMTAVAAKAVDANYKWVIVLAGMTDALRSQTQDRIETDLINQDPERWHRWTTADLDFSHPPDAGFPAPHPASRHIAVIKKNKWILQRFIDTLANTPDQILRNIPFLVIDDECDQASVNAARYRDEMTAINGLIRNLLHVLPRNAYIGYTATPFANVLIDPAVSVDPDHPDDLYPADFIVALPRPDAYFGAESLFGRGLLDADPEQEDSEGLDMIRVVEDDETELLRPRSYQDKDEFSLTITRSFDHAIRYYLMASAARCVRGQANKHSSMLVHTTVYVAPHFDARQRIREHLEWLRQAIRYDDPEVLEQLERQWDSEVWRVDPALFGHEPVPFRAVLDQLEAVTDSVQVVVENGVSEERLDYSGGEARRYIVVGGSVLARGLTIEGLVVSFFLRTSSQYDSLMQMGRWFGYRSGYEDLPRVWMTRDMRDAFKELATVEAEIRNDIEIYREQDITPLDFAVRIRQLPGMSITARNKMLAAESCNISYASEHIQTTRFRHQSLGWLRHNWQAGEDLVSDATQARGPAVDVPRGRLFRDVPVGAIFRFLNAYRTHGSHRDFQAQPIIEYIESQNSRADGCLSRWSVGIVEPAAGTESQEPLGHLGKVRTVVRSLLWDTQEGDADIKALMSRGDILIDCQEPESPGKHNWSTLKHLREAATGHSPLLLLYPIQALSEPGPGRGTARDGRPTRASLNAAMDVLGVGIVFPDSPIETARNYVRVRLPDQEYETPELPEIAGNEEAAL